MKLKDVVNIGASDIQDTDCFMVHNYTNPECNYIGSITFKDLCKAIAKQLVEDGAIPGGDE